MRTVTIRLDELPSTGTVWSCFQLPDGVNVEQNFELYYSGDNAEELIGGGGAHVFTFSTNHKDPREITIVKARPWQSFHDDWVQVIL